MARNYKEEWEEVRTQLLNTATITPVKKEDLTFLQILEEDIKKYFTDDSLTSKVKGEIEKVAIATMERTSFQEKYKSDKEKIYKYSDNDSKVRWNKAIDIFRDRLTKRYFETIDWILEKGEKEDANSKWKGEGFAIVTLQCALIETFAAFRKGKVFGSQTYFGTKEYDGYTNSYKYDNSGDFFQNFLEKHFSDTFKSKGDEKEQGKEELILSKDFYKDVRCGLMHQTRTKGEWLIKVYKHNDDIKEKELTGAIKDIQELKKESTGNIKQGIENIINSVNGDGKPPVIAKKITDENKKTQFHLYRTVLHLRLFGYLMTYCEELKEENENGKELRRNFARCMDHLFDFKPDYDVTIGKYYAPEWWVEEDKSQIETPQVTTGGESTSPSAPQS